MKTITENDFPHHIHAGIARHQERTATMAQQQNTTPASKTQSVLDDVDQVLAQTKTPEYSIDKATGTVTMHDGKVFNPFTGEGTENLTLEQLQVHALETARDEMTLDEKVAELAQRVVEHDNEAGKHTAIAKEAKAELAGLLGPGSYDAGNLKVSVSRPASKFATAKFTEAFPIEMNATLYKSVLDTSAIPPKLKQDYMEPGTGAGTVTVK